MKADLQDLSSAAQQLARSGSWPEAGAVLRSVLERDADHFESLLWLAAVTDDAEESLRLLGRAYTVKPESARVAAGLDWARGRMNNDRTPVAETRLLEAPSNPFPVPAFEPTMERTPERPTPRLDDPAGPGLLINRSKAVRAGVQISAQVTLLLDDARAALDIDDLESAITSADQAARLDPSSIDPLLVLGVAYYRADRDPDAERVYRRLLAIRPDHAEGLANLGLLQAEAGRLEEAEQLYRRAIDQDATLDEVRLALADVLLALGRVDGAVAEWRLAAERNPAISEFQVRIGDAYASAHRHEEAAAAYARALERTPDDPGLRLRLGRMIRMSGRTGAAIEQFREACRSPLASAECFVELAGALSEVGRMDEASDALDQALAIAPDDPAALELLTRIRPPSRRAPPSGYPRTNPSVGGSRLDWRHGQQGAEWR